MEQVVYRNPRWNLKIAFYMAGRGLGWIGAPLLILSYWLIRDSLVGGIVMALIIVLSAGIPFVRAVTGKVWIEDGYLCSRNAFRTVRYPLSDVGRITRRALRQNFFVVGAIESASRGSGNSQR